MLYHFRIQIIVKYLVERSFSLHIKTSVHELPDVFLTISFSVYRQTTPNLCWFSSLLWLYPNGSCLTSPCLLRLLHSNIIGMCYDVKWYISCMAPAPCTCTWYIHSNRHVKNVTHAAITAHISLYAFNVGSTWLIWTIKIITHRCVYLNLWPACLRDTDVT